MTGASKPKTLDFNTAVITGAGGGLGKAMATWLQSQGKKVILVGRSESNLQSTSRELQNAPYYVLDTGKVADAPSFAAKVIKEHPEVDCLINNAGVQRTLNILDLDLKTLDQEIDINVRGPIHLFNAFLEHFKSRPNGAVVMNVTSTLGFNPVSIINPSYNGTKTYMHFFSLCQRTQLKDTKIRIVEIAPPAVGTDLHRDRADPDDNKKHKNPIALTVEEFMEELIAGWKADQDLVTAGPGKELTKTWQEAFGAQYDEKAEEFKAPEGWKSE